MDTKIEQIIEILKKRNLKMSACESFTGGAFSHIFTNVSGSSEVFIGSFISYSNEFKLNQVKVNKRVIKKYGVISQQCAEEMVLQTNKRLKTHLCVSFTGNAGPNPSDDKPVGLGYVAIYFLGILEVFEINQPNLARQEFKTNAVELALNKILEIIS